LSILARDVNPSSEGSSVSLLRSGSQNGCHPKAGLRACVEEGSPQLSRA